MQTDNIETHASPDSTLRRTLRGIGVGLLLFATLGTVTAVWDNPFFTRMTLVGPWELTATAATAMLAGLTSALWVPQCHMRASGTGGIASFLGIACPTCNKVLMLIFGGPALLAWFDPVRPYLALAGMVVMAWATFGVWRRFSDSRKSGKLAPSTVIEGTGLGQ